MSVQFAYFVFVRLSNLASWPLLEDVIQVPFFSVGKYNCVDKYAPFPQTDEGNFNPCAQVCSLFIFALKPIFVFGFEVIRAKVRRLFILLNHFIQIIIKQVNVIKRHSLQTIKQLAHFVRKFILGLKPCSLD